MKMTSSIMLRLLIPIVTAMPSAAVVAQGYLSTDSGGVIESRAALCKIAGKSTNQKNISCGPIRYEPQSIEGSQGFPQAGPPDGKIASAGLSRFSALDEQTLDRWLKPPLSSGKQTFEWTFTERHSTQDFKYYITKPNWDPNQPLSRDSFDLNSFCQINGNRQLPVTPALHNCNVPQRNGYQVILAVWDLADTETAFYHVIDADFGDTQSSQDLEPDS